ncbi:MAG: DUF1080 domain-containing protein [Planctomycetes bacterium]|nr:DUF1080 domain-containing protein [Planctomycetota bacterium]
MPRRAVPPRGAGRPGPGAPTGRAAGPALSRVARKGTTHGGSRAPHGVAANAPKPATITRGGKSGVFLRDPVPRADRLKASDGGTLPWDACFEAQINADDPNYSTGSIWDLAKAPAGLLKAGEWNEMIINVEGDRVQTWG